MTLPPEILAHDLAAAIAEADLLRYEVEKVHKENEQLRRELARKGEALSHLKWVIKKQRQKLVATGGMLRGGREVA